VLFLLGLTRGAGSRTRVNRVDPFLFSSYRLPGTQIFPLRFDFPKNAKSPASFFVSRSSPLLSAEILLRFDSTLPPSIFLADSVKTSPASSRVSSAFAIAFLVFSVFSRRFGNPSAESSKGDSEANRPPSGENSFALPDSRLVLSDLRDFGKNPNPNFSIAFRFRLIRS